MGYSHKDKVTDKRLPIIFLMDVSGSMLEGTRFRNRLTLLNDMLVELVKECMSVQKIRQVAEVSFVLFTNEILLDSEFRNICWMDEEMLPPRKDRHQRCGKITWKTERIKGYDAAFQIPQFGVSIKDGGTNIGYALKQAVLKLEKRVQELEKFGSYPPFLILISDGHPKEPGNPGYYEDLADQEEAIELLRRHTTTHRGENNLIFPFVIGVGGDDINLKRLADYAQNFTHGYFHIKDNNPEGWSYLTEILAKSVRDSVTVNDFAFFDDMADTFGNQRSE